MAKLLPALRQVRAANTEVEITETFPLSDLVTGDLTKLIRYSGGLTTPGCNEIVKVRSNFKRDGTEFMKIFPVDCGGDSRGDYRVSVGGVQAVADQRRKTSR